MAKWHDPGGIIDMHFSENVRNAMTITCSCGQSYTMGQWPAGHYTVICSCGKPLLTRDGTGVQMSSHKTETPAPTFSKPESPVDVYPGDAPEAQDPPDEAEPLRARTGKHKAK